VVLASRVESGDAHAVPQRRLAAYITIDPNADEPALKTGLETEQVSHWQQVFENEVRDFDPAAAGLEATFNTAGWNSSYDGQPLPAEAMREWLDQTVDRVLALRPRRVLEIGCGTGLQLFRIAPQCEHYWGTDFAGAALNYVQSQLAAHAALQPKVRLLHRRADDFTDLEPASFDLVLLNSVAQYFPSLEYVLDVLEKAARVVAPGGCLFVGDVRSLPLLEAFHTWTALAHAPADMSTARLKQRIRKRMQQESELVIAPAFFMALRRRIARVSGVQIQLKRGRHLNELTQFRYDVVLQLDGPAPQTREPGRTLAWGAGGATLDTLRDLLSDAGPGEVRVTGVPNARLLGAAKALDLLNRPDAPGQVSEIRAALQTPGPDPAVDPETMWELGERYGRHTVVSWSGGEADGRFEVVFQPRGSREGAPSFTAPSTGSDERSWEVYANRPWQEKLAGRLGPELRRHLKECLPAYMVPTSLTFLETLPLTPNGKVDHDALPPPETAWMEGETGFIAPRSPVEQTLAEVWQQVLGLEQVGVHHNFFELGGDSIHSIQVVARAHQAGLRLTPRQLFQYPTIAGLAAVVEAVSVAPAEQGLVLGAMPLTPIQCWFFEQELPEPEHWNQAVLFAVHSRLDPEKLAQAIFHLLNHHDTLRLRFTRSDAGGWRQDLIGPDDLIPVSAEDLSGMPAETRAARIECRAAEAQASLNLAEGPLLRVLYFNCGPAEPGRLLWLVHHLAVDGVSWRVLLEDWYTTYRQLERGQAVALPPKTTSFKQWAERLSAYAHADSLRREAAYWLHQPYARAPRLPLDLPDGLNREESAETIAVSLDAETTRALLREVPAAYHTQIDDVLLTALVQAAARWTGKPHLLLDLEGHGREDIFEGVDVSRTVGWFTTLYPVVLGLSPRPEPGEALKAIKEQLRQIPHRGLGYGVLRYLSPDAALADALRGLPQAQLSFNYLGQLDQALPPTLGIGLATEASGPVRSGRGRRRYLLAMGGSVTGGRLHLGCTYSRDNHHAATIRRLMEDWADCLRALITHCLSPEAGGFTPSDFPYAGLSQADLDDLLTDMNEVDA
jgi:non-ribosomal peptide synthase protein (TIGR01720 family)